jgi:hypothetical protein
MSLCPTLALVRARRREDRCDKLALHALLRDDAGARMFVHGEVRVPQE